MEVLCRLPLTCSRRSKRVQRVSDLREKLSQLFEVHPLKTPAGVRMTRSDEGLQLRNIMIVDSSVSYCLDSLII